MSRLKELINKLCPDGVEYKPLWQVTIWDKRFNGVEETKQAKVTKFRHVSAKELKNLKRDCGDVALLSTGDFSGYTRKDDVLNNYNSGEVIAIPSGGTANVKYYNGEFIDSGNILAVSSNKDLYDLKFIYYSLLTKQNLLQSYFRGSGIKHPEMSAVLEIQLPFPPIEVQREIVEILDKFTEYDTELQSELQGRIKQYEYYRDRLLSFDTDIPKVKLGEAFYIKNGYTPSKSNPEYWEQGAIPWFRMEDIRGNGRVLEDSIQHVTPSAVKGELFPANSVILSTTATIGEPAYITVPFLTNQQITCIWPKEKYINKIDPKFVFYYSFRIGQWCKIISNKGGGLPIVSISKLKEYDFPLPPLAVQSRIVGVLDNFDKICSDLKIGLPAEIEKRQQQYEFYRDAILTFVEKGEITEHTHTHTHLEE